MSHGFREVRTVKMEPGPDGKLVPNVYIDRRPLTEEEAKDILKDQQQIFAGFDTLFSNMDGFFSSFDGMFKTMEKQVSSFMKKHGEGNVGPRR